MKDATPPQAPMPEMTSLCVVCKEPQEYHALMAVAAADEVIDYLASKGYLTATAPQQKAGE